MKKITNKTILKQGDKYFHPIEVDCIIYWTENFDLNAVGPFYNTHNGKIYNNRGLKEFLIFEDKIVAQSLFNLKIPVISLEIDDIVTKLNTPKRYDSVKKRYNYSEQDLLDVYSLGQNQYTLKDIEKAIELAQASFDVEGYSILGYTKENILEQINSISLIEVDEQFNVLSYE